MENKYYVCHDPSSLEKNRVGSAMAAIKARNMKDSSTKEEFISEIWSFVEKPSKEKAKLKGAVPHALEFCNVQAMPITDFMARIYQATIKRVSDKNRNPSNKANATELEHILFFKDFLAHGNEPNPIVEKHENSVHFYYPIVINDMCLKCYGKQG